MHAKLHGDIVVEVFDLKLGAENVTQWILMTHFKKKKLSDNDIIGCGMEGKTWEGGVQRNNHAHRRMRRIRVSASACTCLQLAVQIDLPHLRTQPTLISNAAVNVHPWEDVGNLPSPT